MPASPNSPPHAALNGPKAVPQGTARAQAGSHRRRSLQRHPLALVRDTDSGRGGADRRVRMRRRGRRARRWHPDVTPSQFRMSVATLWLRCSRRDGGADPGVEAVDGSDPGVPMPSACIAEGRDVHIPDTLRPGVAPRPTVLAGSVHRLHNSFTQIQLLRPTPCPPTRRHGASASRREWRRGDGRPATSAPGTGSGAASRGAGRWGFKGVAESPCQTVRVKC